MFGSLKKSLKDSIKKIIKKTEEPEKKEEVSKALEERPIAERPKEVPKKSAPEVVKEKPVEEEKKEPEPKEDHVPEIKEPEVVEEKPKEKRGFFGLGKKITTKTLSEKDIDDFFEENEAEYLKNNVAVEVMDFFKKNLKERLVEKPIKRTQATEFVAKVFEDILFDIVNQGDIDLKKKVKEKKPLLMVFLGFNGSGKTTSIARVAKYLLDNDLKPVLAAGDTFRAASIEQLEVHGEKLGLRTIKHQYGSDSAAVVFDAMKYAESNDHDVVLADTAGRIHTDKNLMEELTKVVRVNKPDLKVLVVDSLTGNDAVEQAKKFDEAVGVDAVIMSKTDVNPKGGSLLSVCYAIKKPILFLGTGQGYDDIVKFDPKAFVKELLA